jgi:DNA-binding transcriptional ArsR family regulator
MHAGTQPFEMPTDDQVDLACDGFRMLADPTRIKIMWALLQGEASVNRLAELVGAAPAAVSQHLAKLRLAKLVQVRREGTFAYYSGADDHVARLLAEALFHADHQVQRRPDHAPAGPAAGGRPARPGPSRT